MDPFRRSFPTALTMCRLTMIPTLWLCALGGSARVAGAALVVAGVTDVFDGRLSRRWNVTSSLGSRLDSIADTGIGISAFGMLIVFHRSVVGDHRIFFVLMPVVSAIVLALGWLRFGKVADYHMLTGRMAGVCAFAYLVTLLWAGRSIEWLLWIVMVLCWVVALDSLLVIRRGGTLDGPVVSPISGLILKAIGRGAVSEANRGSGALG